MCYLRAAMNERLRDRIPGDPLHMFVIHDRFIDKVD